MKQYKFYTGNTTTTNGGTTLDIEGDLGRKSTGGYIKNTGANPFKFQLTNDIDFDDLITLDPGDSHFFDKLTPTQYDLSNIVIKTFKIVQDTSGASSYYLYLD